MPRWWEGMRLETVRTMVEGLQMSTTIIVSSSATHYLSTGVFTNLVIFQLTINQHLIRSTILRSAIDLVVVTLALQGTNIWMLLTFFASTEQRPTKFNTGDFRGPTAVKQCESLFDEHQATIKSAFASGWVKLQSKSSLQDLTNYGNMRADPLT